jgi:hypothetical protein
VKHFGEARSGFVDESLNPRRVAAVLLGADALGRHPAREALRR